MDVVKGITVAFGDYCKMLEKSEQYSESVWDNIHH
jgi:hypothetical protein